jgi:RNA polymerase sigma-70 factor (ECF subfamily)
MTHDAHLFTARGPGWDARDARGWELIRATQRGDRDAYGQLYVEFRPLVATVIRRMVGDPHLVEDLTAETFTRALRAVGTVVEQRQSPAAWLTRIARNLVLDHVKAAATTRAVAVEELPEPRPAGDDDACTATVARMDQAAAAAVVEWCLAWVTDSQRCAIEFYDLDDADGPEAAGRVMGRSRFAVSALRTRGLQTIRERLAAEGLTSVSDCLEVVHRAGARGGTWQLPDCPGSAGGEAFSEVAA